MLNECSVKLALSTTQSLFSVPSKYTSASVSPFEPGYLVATLGNQKPWMLTSQLFPFVHAFVPMMALSCHIHIVGTQRDSSSSHPLSNANIETLQEYCLDLTR